MLVNLLLIALGVALLYGGGELLIRGASRLALALGLSPLVIGLTVVAFGTSSPELAATLVASLKGSPELALGNVLGSNIANIGLILGISALVGSLKARGQMVLREVPFMIGVGVLLLALVEWKDDLGLVDAVIFLSLFAAYLFVLFKFDEVPAVEEGVIGKAKEGGSTAVNVVMVVTGILVLVGGAESLVRGGVAMALDLGVSERVIGLSMVAVGTSLPELASSLVALARKEADILLGNIIGSNVFNVLLVLAITVLVKPMEVDLAVFGADLWIAIIFSLLVVPLLFFGRRNHLHRVEGLILLAAYGVYVFRLF
jgi:cation:H+ antiporter